MTCFAAIARAVLLLLVLWLAPPPLADGAPENSGLGPFYLRSFFPPALPFIDFYPEQALTIPESDLRVTYQYALSNTFFNTESPVRTDLPDPITSEDVDRGLTPDDFQPTGYGMFIDVEAVRHLVALRYGLRPDLEAGLDLAWVSFGGGGLDTTILRTERIFNSVNDNLEIFGQNYFAYYLTYNGEFIHATKDAFDLEAQDPVLSLKWNLGEGGAFLPAMAVKLAYKFPLDSSPEGPAGVVNNGEADTAYSVIVTKRFGILVAHFQLEKALLNDPLDRFESSRTFRMFAAEIQADEEHAYVIQFVSQSRLFKFPVDRSLGSLELNISRPTDLLSVGVKTGRRGFIFSAGLVEDLNSAFNETDIVLFMELGWQW